MAVHSKASLTAAWAAKAATGAILDPDVLELHDVIAVGGALVFPLPTDGSSTSVQVGQTWTVLNPWTVAVPASGKGVTCSTSTGIMTIETNGDGWYLCRLKLNGSIAGIVQECELAMRAMRSSTYYMIQGERIDTPGVMTHLSPEAPGRLGGASPLHFIAGDTLALYGRTGPGGGTRTLTIHSASLICERKFASD